ncbi:MAG: ORF6N domain-containing protein [Tannerellaceae bacterium]|nr:ORF6N domain-containing protein [Tannerellaceae bacterium]
MESPDLAFQNVESKIIVLREQNIILDHDVAQLYGVETKRVNEAVKNNPDKFPEGYVFLVNEEELIYLRSKFSTTNTSKKTRVLPKAFTERGLYMLATILKGAIATRTTIAIIETFTKIRDLSSTISELTFTEDRHVQKSLLKKSSELITDLVGNNSQIIKSETTIELNLAVLKLKHTIKRNKT